MAANPQEEDEERLLDDVIVMVDDFERDPQYRGTPAGKLGCGLHHAG
ncbi:hypothetical protein KIF59_07490 [Enterobacter cloacae subsp. cloacae]|nr:hypothetical protein [Enterobacter cloacae subsp. cloacae]